MRLPDQPWHQPICGTILRELCVHTRPSPGCWGREAPRKLYSSAPYKPPGSCQEYKELDFTSPEPCLMLLLIINSFHKGKHSASDQTYALKQLRNKLYALCVLSHPSARFHEMLSTTHMHSNNSQKPHETTFPAKFSVLTCLLSNGHCALRR